ncbi:hypothetical protein BN1048_00960 [Jeotgalicoccus saudimassiliensis]|uniref:Uracil DNA glycosylase superfamily protein n=1 Tax=Jeotgalicoccus saudimassiliensis TaxID=1461582 RepID=A0A078M2H1_9STAP|nr:hypothetical protein [Jeotgalicoccus saudimassiliensis]CEA00439.1 hypothetical protein BN1048_00960 [Jeotgalicoccus saudimassiliensis]
MHNENIRVLVVGLDKYPRNKRYGPLSLKGYDFCTVAFIPKLNNEKKHKDSDCERLYKITSYRRVMSFLAGKPLKMTEFSKYTNVEKVVHEFKEKGIYFVNIKELEINEIKHRFDENTLIILFGVATERAWKAQTKNLEDELNVKELFFHHPSPQVHHDDWKYYDHEMKNRESLKVNTEYINKTMPKVYDLVNNMDI